MGKVDGLSRRSSWVKRTEGANKNRILLKQEWVKSVYVMTQSP